MAEHKTHRNAIQPINARSQHRPTRRTICRQAQDWQFPNRNRLGRAAECSVWNAIAHIQASGRHPTICMIKTLCRYEDPRQVRRIIKRLETGGLLSWEWHKAVYRSNRLQYVPIALHWDLLRKPEPTLSSTVETTLPKSLGSNCFKKRSEKSEPLARPAPVPEQVQKQIPTAEEPSDYTDTWAKETGWEIPDADLEVIMSIVNRAIDTSELPRDLLANTIETIWRRSTRPVRFWRAFYAKALLKLLHSDAGFAGARKQWERRQKLYLEWMAGEVKPFDLPAHWLKPTGSTYCGPWTDYRPAPSCGRSIIVTIAMEQAARTGESVATILKRYEENRRRANAERPVILARLAAN